MRTANDPANDFMTLIKRLVGKNFRQEFNLDLEAHRELLNVFQVGDYYYYVFNLEAAEFDFVSPDVEKVLGHPTETVTVPLLVNSIHPEDVPFFLNFENKVVEFFRALRHDQILKYKVQYDYRIRKKNGEYIRILQQVITLQFDEKSGGLLRTLGIHTDITHLKKDGQPMLSIMGMKGEPSYIDIDVRKLFVPSTAVISKREKDVLGFLIAGKSSKAIAGELFISTQTVDKHRQNMLRKTSTSSTAELVAIAVRKGWL